jgi:ABC-type branched-subunit amino acid transport system ATPase component
MSALLEVDAIHTYYGLSRALFGVSLTKAKGSQTYVIVRHCTAAP